MAIIVKPHGDFQPTTIAESAKVNDQLNAIYADHNGGLVDVNIATGANVQQEKIHNLTSDLAAITANVNTLFSNFNVVLTTVINDPGEPAAAAVGETELYAPIFVAGHSIGTTSSLLLSQDFVMNIATGSNLQLRYYYGTQLFFAPTITNISGVSQIGAVVHVDITIKARNTAVAQFGIGRAFLQTTDNGFYMAGGGRGQFLSAAGISVDSTIDQSIQTNAVWDQAGNNISGINCSSWIVK